jgi:hypothetical protein
MHTLRPATDSDLEFLIRIDLKDEGISAAYRTQDEKELAAHRLLIKAFIHDDNDCRS